MKILQGKSNSNGIAIGKLFHLKQKVCPVQNTAATSAAGASLSAQNVPNLSMQDIPNLSAQDIQAELEKFEQAKEKASADYDALYEKTLAEIGEEEAQIFFIHKLMLEDDDYYGKIVEEIKSGITAVNAVQKIQNQLTCELKATGDDLIEERCADIKEISEKLVSCLCGVDDKIELPDESVVIYAQDLTPAQTVQFDKSKILGFITETGAKNCHTAILARSMGIPAVTGISEIEVESIVSCNSSETTVIVDGDSGKVIFSPDNSTIEEYKSAQKKQEQEKAELKTYLNKETVAKNGQKIELFANIGNQDDVGDVKANGAEGIGLFRSEFLYLGRNDYPDEETLFQAYKQVASSMEGKQVVIRTIDIGADKQADYFEMPKEENPAMGIRAIRLCFTHEEVFKIQLRAILRASAFGNIAIMFPMIVSVEEVEKAKSVLQQAKNELKAENVAFNENIQVGIMIETPASVIMSDKLAEVSDFFSIGTNDLTQYTLAMDRQNPAFSQTLEEYKEPVLRMIEMTVVNAHKAGIKVCICGELGSDLSLTAEFLRIGVDKLSVVPNKILPLRKKIICG